MWMIGRYDKVNGLEALEVWLWKRMIGTNCIKYVAVLDDINERRTMMNEIMDRKIRLIGPAKAQSIYYHYHGRENKR